MSTEPPLSFYWPTTVMMVDDNQSFLENISFRLNENRLRVMYQDPEKALEALQLSTALNNKISILVESLFLNDPDEDTSDKNLDCNALAHLIYDKDRFSMVSTILVDYAMPQMNGLEFCRALKTFPAKKIMLTGEVGNDLAVAAFNEGVIDGFITKDVGNFIERLNDAIFKMKKRYFLHTLSGLGGKAMHEIRKNRECSAFFQAFINTYNIKEYYQIDQYGSYFGLDGIGCTYWFVIKSEEEINEALDILDYAGDPNNLSPLLQEKSHLLFLFSEAEKKLPIENWGNFIFPIARSFVCNGKYYHCAIISGEIFSLNPQKIASLGSYFKSKNFSVLT